MPCDLCAGPQYFIIYINQWNEGTVSFVAKFAGGKEICDGYVKKLGFRFIIVFGTSFLKGQ